MVIVFYFEIYIVTRSVNGKHVRNPSQKCYLLKLATFDIILFFQHAGTTGRTVIFFKETFRCINRPACVRYQLLTGRRRGG